MKTSTFLLLVFLTVFGLTAMPQPAAAQDDDIDFPAFYNELSPYGQWINTPQYGEAWAYNEPGFRPYYTNGNWEYTDEGWSWNSGYAWGWATFHYGRWEYDANYGWLWIPGYDWAPAWVSWSETGDYYGWAPLGFRSSLSVSYNTIPYERWSFISRRYIGERQLSNYYVPYSRVGSYGSLRIINNQYHENNRRFFRGPDLREAQRYTNNRIESRPISMGRPSARNSGRDWNAAGRETDRRFNREPVRMPQQDNGFGRGRDQRTPQPDNNFGRNRDQQRRPQNQPGVPSQNNQNEGNNNNRNFGFPSREPTRRNDNPVYNGNQQPNRDGNNTNDNRRNVGFNNEPPRGPVNNDQQGRQSQQPRFEQRANPEPAPSGGQPRNYGNDGNRGGRPQRGRIN